MISAASDPAEVADQFETTLIWMADEPMLPGRPYLLKIGARAVNAQIGELKYKVNVNSLEHVAAKTLALNEIGVCNLALDHAVAFDAYKDNRDTGGFILDRPRQQRHRRRRADRFCAAPRAQHPPAGARPQQDGRGRSSRDRSRACCG